jgi:hypothetical protein
VVLEGADGALRIVCSVVVGRYKLAGDAAALEVGYEGFGHGIVGDFVGWYEVIAGVGSLEHGDAG